MCQQQGSLHLHKDIIKIGPLAVEWMTTWTIDNFLRWFRIWNELQSEEMSPTPEILNSRQPTKSKLNQMAPSSKFVHYLAKDWLHGLCSTFYADSESVGNSKVKKFPWNHMLCWEPTSGRGLHHCQQLSHTGPHIISDAERSRTVIATTLFQLHVQNARAGTLKYIFSALL